MFVEKEVIDVDDVDAEKSRQVFQSLSEIFPDACPLYLKELSLDHTSYPGSNFNSLIESLLKTKNYPKKTEQIEVSVPVDASHRNSVEAFLEKYNDPYRYFTQRNVGNEFFEYSKLFLRARFRLFAIKTINNVLIENNKNLTLTYHQLKLMKPDRVTQRSKQELLSFDHCPNQNFQDEVYFLNHEEEINVAKETLKLQLEEARFNNELIECQCCYNDEVLDKDVVTCIEGHVFCKGCVKKSVEVAFGEAKVKFNCLADCGSYFLIESLEGIISKNLYEKIQMKIQESEIKAADITGICFCPYCEYAEALPVVEKVFKCRVCQKESCRYCQEKNHIPLSCEEYEEDKLKTSARARIEAKMTDALLRECYKCKKKFIKEDGCNKMVCTCGAMMCYICRQPVKDYSHFEDKRNVNFNEPSTSNGIKIKKCPLWTNNDRLHLDAVVEAAQIATAEIESENPQLHFETDQLLKGLKRKPKRNK